MKKHLVIMMMVFCLPGIGLAQWKSKKMNLPQSFEGLQSLSTENPFSDADKSNPAIHFHPSFCTVINTPVQKNHALYDELSEDIGFIELIQFNIPDKPEQQFSILFDWGMSADPCFRIYKIGKEQSNYQFIEAIGGLQLFFPGNGYIYSEGHTNNHFNKKYKFRFNGKELQEVEQAFYYVGIRTKTQKPIVLYSDTSQNKAVAGLPAASEIEILLNKEQWYLIKTSFGLLGWFRFDGYRCEEIEELWFAGD